MPRIRNVGGVRPKPFFVCASHFKRSNQWKRLSSRRYYCSESKTILYLDTVYCKFLLYVSIEINPFKHRYFITQTNLVYFGLVNVTMITGTRSESTVVRGVTGV